MRLLAVLAAGACLGLPGLSACVTRAADSSVDQGVSYRLASVDGRPAGDRGFTISFDRSGGYSASFDCAEHFGRYNLAARLGLEPGGSAPGSCDETDLKTGRPIVRQKSFGAQFLSDQPFVSRRRGEELALTGRRHTYILTR